MLLASTRCMVPTQTSSCVSYLLPLPSAQYELPVADWGTFLYRLAWLEDLSMSLSHTTLSFLPLPSALGTQRQEPAYQRTHCLCCRVPEPRTDSGGKAHPGSQDWDAWETPQAKPAGRLGACSETSPLESILLEHRLAQSSAESFGAEEFRSLRLLGYSLPLMWQRACLERCRTCFPMWSGFFPLSSQITCSDSWVLCRYGWYLRSGHTSWLHRTYQSQLCRLAHPCMCQYRCWRSWQASQRDTWSFLGAPRKHRPRPRSLPVCSTSQCPLEWQSLVAFSIPCKMVSLHPWATLQTHSHCEGSRTPVLSLGRFWHGACPLRRGHCQIPRRGCKAMALAGCVIWWKRSALVVAMSL